MHTRQAVRSDIGRKRRENDDAFGLFPEMSLYVVADGLGGRLGGQVASALTIEAIRDALLQTANGDFTPFIAGSTRSLAARRLMMALHHANQRVRDASRGHPRGAGVGTTVAAILFEHTCDLVAIGHVGDSRVYRIRGTRIEELTEDHTVVQRLIRDGRITRQEVKSSPHRHLLTQAIGVMDLVRPDLRVERAAPGDIFILCSDGLHDVVDGKEILDALIQSRGDLEAACSRLIQLANERGGEDNSTILIVSCDAQPEH